MGDCLLTGKPSLFVPNRLGQLSLPSLRGRLIDFQPVWLGLRRGGFTCVGWQVTLCDHIISYHIVVLERQNRLKIETDKPKLISPDAVSIR